MVLKEIVLVPGGEWTPEATGWCFISVLRGVGYWMDSRLNHELVSGSVLLISSRAKGTVRSSQLGEAVCQYFVVAPERLASLMTIAEQRAFEELAQNAAAAVRFFPAREPLCEKFRVLCEQRGEASLRSRARMLDLFTQVFEAELQGRGDELATDLGAKRRLHELLRQMPADDMLALSFGELSSRVGCCPRHLSRLFLDTVGMSFREKQSEVRLRRARELLATTELKVVDVALESGFQSPSLFNLMFKRRFGISPTQWREAQQHRKPRRPAKPLSIVMA